MQTPARGAAASFPRCVCGVGGRVGQRLELGVGFAYSLTIQRVHHIYQTVLWIESPRNGELGLRSSVGAAVAASMRAETTVGAL